MRRRGAASQVLMTSITLVVLGLLLVSLGTGLSIAIKTIFQKTVQIGYGDSGEIGAITVNKVLFVGDDVIEAAAGGYKDINEKNSGRPATINEDMRTALNSISVSMDSVAISGQASQVTVNTAFSGAISQENHGFNGVVFMLSKNETDVATTKQNIDRLINQSNAQGMIIFAVLLPTVGGDANYTKAINQYIKDKTGIRTIDATALRPSNTTDPTTIALDQLRTLIKDGIKTWNSLPASSRGVFAAGNVLPVPLYDQRWKWGFHPSGGKFCGVTSVKMALDYYARMNYAGLQNKDDLSDSVYKSKFVYGWRTQAAWSYYVTGGVQRSDRLDANDWQIVKVALSNGHPIVAYGSWTFGGGHIVVLIGITDTSVSYADPWKGQVRTVSKAKASNYLTAAKYSYAGQTLYLIDPRYGNSSYKLR